MNELSTESKSAVIVFHDGSEVFISQEQYETLLTNYSNPDLKDFRINNSLYTKSSISKVLSLEEFYEEYPKKKPEPVKENQFLKYEGLPSRVPENALPSLIKGLKRFIDEQAVEGMKTPKAQAILDSWVKKYEQKLTK